MIRFEWDPNKNKININKHEVDFEEASTVFFDNYALVIEDPEHSDNEDRFIILGLSIKLNVLVVVHCYREQEEVIRIISARKATRKEIETYNNSRGK